MINLITNKEWRQSIYPQRSWDFISDRSLTFISCWLSTVIPINDFLLVGYHLPRYSNCNWYFMRQILKGEKKVRSTLMRTVLGSQEERCSILDSSSLQRTFSKVHLGKDKRNTWVYCLLSGFCWKSATWEGVLDCCY